MCDCGDGKHSNDEITEENNWVFDHGRTGYVYFRNDWGSNITNLTIRHRSCNYIKCTDRHVYNSVASGETTTPFAFEYYTGENSCYDYWWIVFTCNGVTYTVKDNFYCTVSNDDDGDVYLAISGSQKRLFVNFSQGHKGSSTGSRGCYAHVTQVQGLLIDPKDDRYCYADCGYESV